MKYRKKPVVIEAIQITDSTFDAPHPNPEHLSGVIYYPETRTASVETLEGVMTGSFGDWIITGVEGERYFCKPHIFAMTYEKAEESIEDVDAQGQFDLRALIHALSLHPMDNEIYLEVDGMLMTRLRMDSWRGSYIELTIDHSNEDVPSTVASFYEDCKSSDGAYFSGYKGGDYLMELSTPVWADPYGIYEGHYPYLISTLGKRTFIHTKKKVSKW